MGLHYRSEALRSGWGEGQVGGSFLHLARIWLVLGGILSVAFFAT